MFKRLFSLCSPIPWLLLACGSAGERAPAPQLAAATQQPAAAAGAARPAQVKPPELKPKLEPWEAKGVRSAYSRAGTYMVKWLPVGAEVKKNKHFEIDMWLFKVGPELEPFGGAVVATRGWMPDHGHGMVRQPLSTHLEGGHYRISGMLLHMGGYWQLFFDVVADGQAESTQFDLTL